MHITEKRNNYFTPKSKLLGMTYGARLQSAMDAGKKTRRQLADHLGTSPQRVGIIVTWAGEEERLLTTKAHLDAARYLGVDPYWLATGEGERAPISRKETLGTQLADLFDQLPDKRALRSEVFVQCYQVIAPVVQRTALMPTDTLDVHSRPQKLAE